MFTDLPMDEVSLIAQNARDVSFRSGEILIDESRSLGRAYIIVEGEVRVEGDGPEPPLIRAGEGVGMISLLAGEDPTQRCVATSEVAALEISGEIFWDILEERFPIYIRIVRNVASELLLHRQGILHGTVLAGIVDPREVPPDRPIELVERLILMRKAGIFREASLEAIIELARSFEERRIPAGTRLWELWDPSGFAHFLISGTVRCELGDGRIFRATVGYPVGNLESQANEPRWYTAVAETDLVAFRSETGVFLDVMEDHFDLAEEFLTALARNVSRTRQRRDLRGAPRASR